MMHLVLMKHLVHINTKIFQLPQFLDKAPIIFQSNRKIQETNFDTSSNVMTRYLSNIIETGPRAHFANKD